MLMIDLWYNIDEANTVEAWGIVDKILCGLGVQET